MSPMRPVRFVFRDRVVEVADAPPRTTVLAWLRQQRLSMGTKEGCNEGDCGACMVAVASLEEGALRWRNLNACLLYLSAIDGQALFTVEDLARLNGGQPHPVQAELVRCHASQCGFCTPGFVMTMFATCQALKPADAPPSREAWADALSGNLCRCTGYRPILDAAQVCGRRAAQGEEAWAPESRATLEAALIERLQQAQSPQPLHQAAPDPALGEVRHVHAPRSLASLVELLAAHPDATLLAGATDIGLWTNKQHRDVGTLVSVLQVPEMRGIRFTADELLIGAAEPLEAAWQALLHDHPVLRHLALRFASLPIRLAGTMGGNVANGSPIGDSAPVLMALGASLEVAGPRGERCEPLDGFYTGYQRKRLARDEVLVRIRVPRPAADGLERLHAWKWSKRYDSDISAVCAAVWLRRSGAPQAGGAQGLAAVRMAFGGMAATVSRARRAEEALLRHGLGREGVMAASQALAEDFQPLSDLRASSAARLRIAQSMLWRLLDDGQVPATVWDEAARLQSAVLGAGQGEAA